MLYIIWKNTISPISVNKLTIKSQPNLIGMLDDPIKLYHVNLIISCQLNSPKRLKKIT